MNLLRPTDVLRWRLLLRVPLTLHPVQPPSATPTASPNSRPCSTANTAAASAATSTTTRTTDPITCVPPPPAATKPRAPRSRFNHFIRTLSAALACPPLTAQRVLLAAPELIEHTANIEPACRTLLAAGCSPAAIAANGHLLAQPAAQLAAKWPLLAAQRPRHPDDFVPLLRASAARLQRMRRLHAREAATLQPGGHRVYYLAERLRLDAGVVAQHLSTHLFMFDLHVEQLIGNLDVQLRYGVAAINILRDPWAFRYSTRAIEARLERADGSKDKLMPWMVRCTEQILAKSIQHSVDEKRLLGDRTLVEYVAERLGFDVTTTKWVLDKHPQIYTVRVTKVKEVLDYLLLETDYDAHDVALTPRILCHSLRTTRTRLAELRALGCQPSSLVIVCRSANEYDKFVAAWTEAAERRQRAKNAEEKAPEKR